MGSKTSLLIFLLYTAFSLQRLQTTQSHMKKKHAHENQNHNPLRGHDQEIKKLNNDDDDHKSLLLSSHETPELNVFFHYNTLKLGTRLPLYFPTKDPSITPQFLSQQESASIPFSTPQFSHILKLFSFSKTSKQALAMKTTLDHCEAPPLEGETKFCATSLESLLDSVGGVFKSRFRVSTTSYVSESNSSPALQNYTVLAPPREIPARRIVACHLMPYPYAVFYCHSQDGDDKLYEVSLSGEEGGRVEAAAICHMDTKEWDPRHIAFRVLETGPGGLPVCHFFPTDSLVWIPVS